MSELVSIIMPVYNAGPYVTQAVESVLRQTWSNWELLIVNDGSTDDSLERISGFSDPRIRVFHRPSNQGVSTARNVGLNAMRGAYFCFLDADDVFPPASIAARLAVFDESIAFTDGRVESYDEEMEQRVREWAPRTSGRIIKKLVRLEGSCFLGLTWLIRRDPAVEYCFDTSLTHGEDLWFLISIANQGMYAYTNDVILCYRNRQGSAMKDIIGLANGYTALGRRINQLGESQVSRFDKLVYNVVSRKIMFLVFLSGGQFCRAVRYLFLGRL